MNQVKESRIRNFIESLISIGKALSVNDQIASNTIETKELNEIRTFENKNKIAKLEDEISKVYISLDDSEKIAPKAKISEKLAKERLEQIKAEKAVEKEEKQSQIGD